MFKRSLLTKYAPYQKEYIEITFDIFMRGLAETSPPLRFKILPPLVNLILIPINLAIGLVKSFSRIAILLVLFFVFRDLADQVLEGLSVIILVLSVTALVIRNLFVDFEVFIFSLANFLSGGFLLRYMCREMIRGNDWILLIFDVDVDDNNPFATKIISSYIHLTPPSFRNRYDKLGDLYMNQRTEEGKKELEEYIKSYWESLKTKSFNRI